MRDPKRQLKPQFAIIFKRQGVRASDRLNHGWEKHSREAALAADLITASRTRSGKTANGARQCQSLHFLDVGSRYAMLSCQSNIGIHVLWSYNYLLRSCRQPPAKHRNISGHLRRANLDFLILGLQIHGLLRFPNIIQRFS